MFYTKIKITEEVELRVPLYDDEFFTTCLDCGKELGFEPVEIADIIRDSGLVGTAIRCSVCTESRA